VAQKSSSADRLPCRDPAFGRAADFGRFAEALASRTLSDFPSIRLEIGDGTLSSIAPFILFPPFAAGGLFFGLFFVVAGLTDGFDDGVQYFLTVLFLAVGAASAWAVGVQYRRHLPKSVDSMGPVEKELLPFR
jgi:hypothetical protein